MIKQLLERKYIGLLYVLVSIFLYWPTRSAKFTSDFFSWIGQFEEYGAKGLLTGFDDPGLHPIYHLSTFIMYRLFDLNTLPWFFVFVALHSLNAYLIFKVFGRMLQNLKVPQTTDIAFAASLFFLVSPYQTEVVVWGAALHYLLCVLFCLISIGLLVQYFEDNKPEDNKPVNVWLIVTSFVCFMLALYALEVALMLPFILIAFLALLYFKAVPFHKVLSGFSVFVLPQFVGIFIYFLHQKLKFGQWIGHYGASVHLNFTFELIGTTLNRYFLKFLTFFRYLPSSPSKHEVYLGTAAPVFTTGILLIVGLLIIVALILIFGLGNKKSIRTKEQRTKEQKTKSIKTRSIKTKSQIVLVFFFTFIAALFPVINLETTSLLDIQSDRYGYFASVFYCLFFSGLLFFLFKRTAWTLASFWIGVSIFLLVNTNKSWTSAGIIAAELSQNYEWFDNRRVYVMNLPDNFNGAYLFRCGFREAIEKYNDREVNARIIRTVMYNWKDLDDCLPVKIVDEHEVTARLDGGGKWWIHQGAGATSYDRETHQFSNEGASYRVLFKDFDPEQDVVIYPCGSEWKILDL